MALIMFKRGEALNIPALKPGEPGWCLDTGELFIGTNENDIWFDLSQITRGVK